MLSNGAPGDSNAGSTGGKCFLQGLVGGDAGAGTISKRTGHGGFGKFLDYFFQRPFLFNELNKFNALASLKRRRCW